MSDEEEFWNPKRHRDDAPRSPRPLVPGAFTAREPTLLQRVLDRVDDLRSDARVGVALLVVVAVLAGVVWYRIGVGGGGGDSVLASPKRQIDVPATPKRKSAGAMASTTTSAAVQQRRISVHVAGAVARPGVVELAAGSRVIDAVEAVGGAPADADLDRLNLAAKLVDGERVFVPKVGQADPGVADGGGESAGSSGSSATATAGGKLNLNTATQAQLEALPGIGPSYAQAILAERQRRRGFKSVNELRSVRGIGDKRFAEIAPLVTV